MGKKKDNNLDKIETLKNYGFKKKNDPHCISVAGRY